MNTATWIPDLFMKRVEARETRTLFRSSDVPDLHELYGAAFEARYAEHEERARRGEIHGESVPAIELWKLMLKALFETGHPWITFKDPCNVRSPQDHAGVVHSSNLCTEITLNTSVEETAAGSDRPLLQDAVDVLGDVADLDQAHADRMRSSELHVKGGGVPRSPQFCLDTRTRAADQRLRRRASGPASAPRHVRMRPQHVEPGVDLVEVAGRDAPPRAGLELLQAAEDALGLGDDAVGRPRLGRRGRRGPAAPGSAPSEGVVV